MQKKATMPTKIPSLDLFLLKKNITPFLFRANSFIPDFFAGFLRARYPEAVVLAKMFPFIFLMFQSGIFSRVHRFKNLSASPP